MHLCTKPIRGTLNLWFHESICSLTVRKILIGLNSIINKYADALGQKYKEGELWIN